MLARLIAVISVGPLAVVCAGCQTEPANKKSVAATEPTLAYAKQLDAVRRGESNEIRLQEEELTDQLLRRLADCPTVRVISAERSSITSDGFALIGSLKKLEQLKLVGSKVDDDSMSHLAELTNLQRLNLPDARFTDRSLAILANLPALNLLRFGSPNVSDEGMLSIAQMRSLRFLHLMGVQLTDEGIRAIHGMTWLESFYLDGGNATDEGLRQLLTALPELHFHRDQLHIPSDDRHDH